jgi:hypothetical protein
MNLLSPRGGKSKHPPASFRIIDAPSELCVGDVLEFDVEIVGALVSLSVESVEYQTNSEFMML